MNEIIANKSISSIKKDKIFYFLRISISILLLGIIISKNYKNFQGIFNILINLRYIFLVFAIFIHFVSLYIDSLQWNILLRAQGIKIRMSYIMQLTLISFFYDNLLPSNIGGDFYVVYDVLKNLNVPMSKSISSIVIERFFGLISIIIYFLITSFSLYKLLKHSIIIISIFLVVAFLLFFMIIRPQLFKIDRLLKKFKKLKKIWKNFDSFNSAINSYKNKWPQLILALTLNFLSQSIFTLMFYFASISLGLNINFMVFVFVVPVVFVFIGIPISIGGLGIRENTIVFLLTKFNVSNDQAVAFSLLILFVYIFSAVVGGMVYLFKNIFYKSKGFI